MLSAEQVIELQRQGWIQADYHLTELFDGTVNRNFCLTSGQKRFFLKLFSQSGGDRQDRLRQFDLQQRIAAHGMAPEPLYVSERHDFMLEAWLEIQDLASARLSKPQKIQRLAERLFAIHQLPIDCADLPLVDDWQHYIQRGAIQDRTLLAQVEELSPRWLALPKPVFCHHDLCLAHVCLMPKRVCLDWEYAAMSTPVYDIASSILAEGLDAQQGRWLSDSYAKISSTCATALWQEVQQMRPFAELTNRLWHLAHR
ncbi:hypothetical protein GCM10009092_32620 [Bowmanella denitrificans]|uniref:Aminoglycoside phosphotransferase domain-containing protein n=1 Tax=Bowmanella denitrificans TaxID=366582 RepID=A0ABN0XJJ5_9ALTE